MVIEFAIDDYNRFLALCDPASRVLKNGLVVRRPKNGKHEQIVEIFAQMRDAQMLLVLGRNTCPAAVPAIVKAMSVAHV